MREPATPRVEIVIPVFNEERALAASVRAVHRRMSDTFAFPFRITIADNASEDRTLERARRLAAELPEVELLHLAQKGRGRALRAAWSRSDAEVVGYMDVDLSTDLAALEPLLGPLLQKRADVTIGTRLAPGSEVTRGIKRELISRAYNILARTSLGLGVSDAQCGFRAARREAIAPLLSLVEDDGWFFDTELLWLARRARLSIHEVPVRWIEDRDSRVDIVATAREDLRGIARLRRSGERRRAPLPAGEPGQLAEPALTAGSRGRVSSSPA